MKKIITIILAIFLISFVSADLIITPNTFNIDVKRGEIGYISFNLSNTFNFNIFNFEFKDLTGFTFPNITLEPNQTVYVTSTILRNDLFSGAIESDVSFKYLVDIPNTPQTHNIDITEEGFSPDFITIHEGDTIIWHNLDDVSHTVTSGSFDNEIQANTTLMKTFAVVETIDYQDLIMFWSGRIQVLSRSLPQEVNNPNYNKKITVNLNVFSNPTNLSAVLSKYSFNVDAIGSKTGSIFINNEGSEIAQKVKLTADSNWIIFNENEVNIEPDDSKTIEFKIQPVIFASNETNRTYFINIKAKGLNTEEYILNMSVYVPYYAQFGEVDSNEGFMLWFANVYCPTHQGLFLCNTSADYNGQQRVIIKDPAIPLNLTLTQFYAMLKRQAKDSDTLQRMVNEQKETNTKLNEQLLILSNQVNESVKNSVASKKKSDTTSNVFWIILIFAVIITVIYFIVRTVSKYNKQQYLMGRLKAS